MSERTVKAVPATAAPSQPVARKFLGYIAFGCGKHVRNAMGAHIYNLDCLDCQRQPMLAWFEGGEPPIQKEAAERERDSLREDLDHAVDCFNRSCKRCNQIAALKAGKDGQQ